MHEIVVVVLVTTRRAFDTRCCGQDFPLWVHAWVYRPIHKKDLLPKLSNHWVWPCKVLEQVVDMVYHTVGKWRACSAAQRPVATLLTLCYTLG